jgi:hypothetical protein
MTLGERPDRQGLPIAVSADLLEQLHSRSHSLRRLPPTLPKSAEATLALGRSGAKSSVHSGANSGVRAQTPAIGVQSNTSWPCGQNSQPKPEYHRRRDPAPRGERPRLLVLTAAPVPYFYGRHSTGLVAAPRSDRPLGGSRPLPSRADPTEGRKGVKTMTSRRRDWAARTRGQLNRERGSRRLLPAIDAQRSLNAPRAEGSRTKAHPVDLSDPRYA